MAICLKINTFNAATLILLEISSFWYGYQERQRHSYGKQNAQLVKNVRVSLKIPQQFV